MFDTFVRVMILSLLIGFPMYISRLIILRKELTTKVLTVQSVILVFYLLIMFLLQTYDLNNQSIYLTNVIVIFWLGFYLIIEPVIIYFILFKANTLKNIRLREYGVYSTVFSVIFSVTIAFALIMYAVSNGLSA